MGKELEAIKIKIEEAYKQLWHEREYAYDSKVCSKGKGWAEAIQHYDNIGRNLLEVKRILDDLLTKYEAIDNANPSGALEILDDFKNGLINKEIGMVMFNQYWFFNQIEKVKQALLKAQEPKQYLKWEDLEFDNNAKVKKYLKVKLGDNIYKAYYHYCFILNSELFCIENDNENLNIYITNKQFFNDLHLEVVE